MIFFFQKKKETFVSFNDIDYRYSVQDYLSKRNSSSEYVFIVITLAAVFINKYAYHGVLPYVGFFFNLV